MEKTGTETIKREDIMRRTGHMSQVAEIREIAYCEGRAKGMGAYQVKNGPLQFTVMKDKCLDLAELSYRGVQMSFLTKPGLQGRNHYDTNGDEAQRSIMGGMLFTCGLENVCAPCEIDGKEYPMHGRIRTTPAEHAGAETYWEGDTYQMRIHGTMREAELFGENLVLRREITTEWPEKEIRIHDIIENQGFREEPMMILYHFNMGYPLLDEGAKIVLPTCKVTPRDEAAAPHTEQYGVMEAPVDEEPECVFLHELAADEDGNTFAALINEKLGLGIRLSFSKKNLPYFMQWKALASGDYVIGLEPANSSVYGRGYHVERDTLHTLAPQACEEMELTITVLEGEELQQTERLAEQLKKMARE